MPRTILFVLGGVALLGMLLGDGVATAWAFGWLNHRTGTPVGRSVPAKTTKADFRKGKIEFVDTGKMVVTLPPSASSGGSQSYLEIDISFATYDKNAAVAFRSYKPMVKASLISAIMEDGPQLLTGSAAAKRRFAKTALGIADTVVSGGNAKLPSAPFAGAYITNFILQ